MGHPAQAATLSSSLVVKVSVVLAGMVGVTFLLLRVPTRKPVRADGEATPPD